MTPDSPQGMTVWCAGLPLAARRPLTGEEQAALRREAGGLRQRGCLLLPLVPIALLALMAVFAGFDRVDSSELTAILVVLLVVLPVALLAINSLERLQRGSLLRADLCEGRLARFEGMLDEGVVSWWKRHEGVPFQGRSCREPSPPFDQALYLLLQAGLLRPEASSTQWLEVLPVSGRVWRANDQLPARWITVRWVVVAETPEYAAMAASWLEPVARAPEGTVQTGQRALSDAEREELRRRTRATWRTPLVPALLLSLWFYPLLIGFIVEDRLPPGWYNLTMFCLLGVVTVLSDLACLARIRQATRMAEDMRGGVVSVVRVSEGRETETAPEGLGQEYEYLPASRLLWTEAGQPAAWRRRAQ